ncbi:hypothetical protein HS088_TW01G00057 [Tripterygium wilfordii]|uniref:Uncharacterized protein n=1 Tax=Tripterygium wilfordii TaxID=458696 RepID=A0A7J7E0H6_TRIWF|nr:hypothetical protein HS088_TW01G00057 [Tripterygium wilfordii]
MSISIELFTFSEQPSSRTSTNNCSKNKPDMAEACHFGRLPMSGAVHICFNVVSPLPLCGRVCIMLLLYLYHGNFMAGRQSIEVRSLKRKQVTVSTYIYVSTDT